jgi:hypothetical protein
MKEQCVFCPAMSSRKGEHAWVRWLVSRRWKTLVRITTEEDGIPITNRDKVLQRIDSFPYVLLPVCDSLTGNGCNQRLEAMFEAKGRAPVSAVLLESRPLTSASEVQAFARWWLKTLLLLHHPSAREIFPKLKRRPWTLPAMTYPGLLNGVFPRDMSMWVAVGDDAHGSAHLPEQKRVWLLRTGRRDGEGGVPESGVVGFSLASGRIAYFQLAVHPLCDVDNPFEEAGLAIRLWPDPPGRMDLDDLPILDAMGRRQFGSLFTDSGVGAYRLESGWRFRLPAVAESEPIPFPPEVIMHV